MKKITKFLLNVTSVGSIVLIATLNLSQFAVTGEVIPDLPNRKKPPTVSAGPRFIQPKEDRDITDSPPTLLPPGDRPPTMPRGPLRLEKPRVPGNCENFPEASFTALVPKNKIARTVSDYPTFFFYLPQPNAELAEFILEDENGNLIYAQALTIKNLSGVISVSIPANANVPPLEVGKNYIWKFSLVCDREDRLSDKVERGFVRRVELSADILGELENADPRQKTFIYAKNGIWQEALSNLAAVRRANPNNPVFKTDWESLLDSVTLGEIAKEPIVEIEPQP
jgi:hypothetical protein